MEVTPVAWLPRAGEFAGWSRTETDYFCHQLQTVIIESGVSGYVFACGRRDWDELMTGQNREIFGDPERACVWNCFVRAHRWAQSNTFDPHIAFMFDNRDGKWRDYNVVGDAFKRHLSNPEIATVAFGSSTTHLALQAADLIAWEFYQYAIHLLMDNKLSIRQQFHHLVRNVKIDAQITTRSGIEKIIAHAAARDPEFMKATADHFMTFDPDAPSVSD
jgi:hypothetical protein